MKDMSDWDETDTIELSKGDVIVVRFFKSSPTSFIACFILGKAY